MMYKLSISIAKNMLDNEIISSDDYAKIKEILLEKYKPYISELIAK